MPPRRAPRDPLPSVVEWHLDPEKTGYEKGFPADTFRWIRIDEGGTAASNATFDDAGTLIRGNFPRVRAEKQGGNLVKVETKGVKRFLEFIKYTEPWNTLF